MLSSTGDKKQEKRHLEEAQAIKDATMGYRISQHLRPQHTFLHLNGSYHSLQNGGIIPYLRRYAPKTRIVTITPSCRRMSRPSKKPTAVWQTSSSSSPKT